MARKIDALPPGRSNHRYPWDEWLDGSAWELTPEDFPTQDALNFRTQAYNAAKKRGLRVTVRLNNSDGTIALQARPDE